MPLSTREQLLHLLAEAAELEHNILCSYLFAAFSLKQDESEDLSPAECAEVQGWRGQLMAVCVEEMLHLAQVGNLMAAIGARPHFNRPNLPVPPGYHPAGIEVRLAPFDRQTLDHFIFLERPEDCGVRDSPRFAREAAESAGPARTPVLNAGLMPAAPDYATIGEFYRRIADGLGDVAAQLGDAALFCGPSDCQLRAADFQADDLIVVTDLASARRAIDLIVEQGEGSPGAGEISHFQRFETIRARYAALCEARPGFCPHRPVATNPVMRAPTEVGRVHITATAAAHVLDIANACYAAMLRALSQLYDTPSGQPAAREALSSCAVACMHLVAMLGSHLTTLPAAPGSSVTAGLTFTMLRATEGLMPGGRPAAQIAEWLCAIDGALAVAGLDAALAQRLQTRLRPALHGLAALSGPA